MRTLKYAILGLLNSNPLTGYDITKAFMGTINNFWSAKHSQIYPELKKLVSEGLVEFTIEITGEILEKKLYTITKLGKKDLLEWLSRDEPFEKTAKDTFRLRMYFSQSLPDQQIIELLDSQINQHQKCLDELLLSMNRYTNRKPSRDELGDYLVLKGGISRETAYIDWLKECLAYF